MSVLTEYFVAATDDVAASVDADAPPQQALHGGGIEPTVHLATLEELLTGRSFDDILDDEADPVADRDDGDDLVVRLSDELLRALVAAPDGRLDELAVPWSQTEELEGADPAVLAEFAHALAALARQARADGASVYCWVHV